MKRWLVMLACLVVLAGCGGETTKTETQNQNPAEISQKLIQQGLQLLQQKRVPHAFKAFHDALRVDPKNANSYVIVSEIYMKMGRHEDALKILFAARDNDVVAGSIYYLMAINQNMTGNHVEALENAKKSTELFLKEKDKEGVQRSIQLVQAITAIVNEQQ